MTHVPLEVPTAPKSIGPWEIWENQRGLRPSQDRNDKGEYRGPGKAARQDLLSTRNLRLDSSWRPTESRVPHSPSASWAQPRSSPCSTLPARSGASPGLLRAAPASAQGVLTPSEGSSPRYCCRSAVQSKRSGKQLSVNTQSMTSS